MCKSQHGMCKRNSPHKNKASTGCLRVTPPQKKQKKQQQQKTKNETSTECVRETPQIERGRRGKPAWDIQVKPPTEK